VPESSTLTKKSCIVEMGVDKICPREGILFDMCRLNVKCRVYAKVVVKCAAAMRPFTRLLWTLVFCRYCVLRVVDSVGSDRLSL